MQGGIIGFGYWGKILCKNFKDSKKLLTVFDVSKEAQDEAKKKGFQTVDSLDQILESDKIKFLIIASFPSSHDFLVKKGMEHGKHILVEKPFGFYSKDKSFLFQKAKEQKRVLMIDYSFIYSPGFQKLKELMRGSEMKSYESLRMNAQLPVWNVDLSEDLIIHDLSMLVEIIPSLPICCSYQPLEFSDRFQTALISIMGLSWRSFVYASRDFSEKKRLVFVKSSKRAIEFKEIDRKHYIRLVDSKSNTEINLKGKNSLEIMFEEFFNRISGQSKSEDFVRYNKISSILRALNESFKNNAEKTKIQWNF